jgi:hypothetical protein
MESLKQQQAGRQRKRYEFDIITATDWFFNHKECREHKAAAKRKEGN